MNIRRAMNGRNEGVWHISADSEYLDLQDRMKLHNEETKIISFATMFLGNKIKENTVANTNINMYGRLEMQRVS